MSGIKTSVKFVKIEFTFYPNLLKHSQSSDYSVIEAQTFTQEVYVRLVSVPVVGFRLQVQRCRSFKSSFLRSNDFILPLPKREPTLLAMRNCRGWQSWSVG